MKVYLDDQRTPNHHEEGLGWQDWVLVRTIKNFVLLVRTGLVTEVSFDYVLEGSDRRFNGLDAAHQLWRYCRANPDYMPPRCRIHSAHDKGRKLIQEVVDQIEQKAAPKRMDVIVERVGQRVGLVDQDPREPERKGCITSCVMTSDQNLQVPVRLHYGGMFRVKWNDGSKETVPGDYLQELPPQ